MQAQGNQHPRLGPMNSLCGERTAIFREAVASLFSAILTYSGFNSIPVKSLPSFLATTSVVPLPANMSKTIPGRKRLLHLQPVPVGSLGAPHFTHTFSGQLDKIGLTQTSSGYTAKWANGCCLLLIFHKSWDSCREDDRVSPFSLYALRDQYP